LSYVLKESINGANEVTGRAVLRNQIPFRASALDAKGLPVAWELQNFGHLGIKPNADPDRDGMSNLQEYLAGTNPNNANSVLRVTTGSFASEGTNASLTWNSVTTRFYYPQKTLDLTTPVWMDTGLGLVSPFAGSTTTAGLTDTNAPARFYRVQAVRPLMP
jgi:hypothetical protein